ncbi:hypothetical protein L209DRAFT_499341 [Thermothelomyces heterothallicus CBS 203.75]
MAPALRMTRYSKRRYQFFSHSFVPNIILVIQPTAKQDEVSRASDRTFCGEVKGSSTCRSLVFFSYSVVIFIFERLAG